MTEYNIESKVISSLEKVLIDGNASQIENRSYILKDEQLNFQLVYKNNALQTVRNNSIEVEGDLKPYVSLRIVENVPVEYVPIDSDDYYISKKSGLYPDRLAPIGELGIVLNPSKQKAVWVSVFNKKGLPAGVHELKFHLYSETGQLISTLSYTVEVLDMKAETCPLKLTTWMHYDCICQEHKVKPFSKKFYKIFSEYLKLYTHIGMNMLLTPIFTPPLDTQQGGERLTVQLVDVYFEDGKYRFNFDKLAYFLKFVLKRGIKYIEFSHLFTQWGGYFCPKIMVRTENGYENVFGWNVEQTDKRYVEFLNAFLPELYKFTESLGITDKCYYHLTDEPKEEVLDNYEKARSLVKKHIGNCRIMDAMSHYSFYSRGLVDTPVCYTVSFPEFRDKQIDELFTYYCCGPSWGNYSNRFINMPSLRTRIIGVQLYETGVQGFLHWGFNFYNSVLSIMQINPNITTDAGGLFPAGDAFIVYPHGDGVYSSVRAEILKEAVQDYNLLLKLERQSGKEEVLSLLSKYGIKGYDEYSHDEKTFALFKSEIYEKLKANRKKSN